MKKGSSAESQERLKEGLEAVKRKIVSKKGPFIIRRPVKDFLADNYLIPIAEDKIGGAGSSDEIIDTLFRRGRLDATSTECLAKRYEKQQPDYWGIMRKHLRRFFHAASDQRDFTDRRYGYDFHPWDYPRPDNYPTPKEQGKVWDKACKVRFKGLSRREKYVLKTFLEEQSEEESETIYYALQAAGKLYNAPGWTFPDFNFRYIVLLDPSLKKFWQWCGLQVNENTKFLLSREIVGYRLMKLHGRKWKMPKFSIFNDTYHGEYAQLRSKLKKEARIAKAVFREIEDTYLCTQLVHLISTLSRIVRPFFLVAHFLQDEDPNIYNDYWNLTKYYIQGIESGNATIRKLVARDAGIRRIEDFLFESVWQDFLFDRTKYLKEPKARKDGRGRPPKISTHLLVYVIKSELKKHKAKLSDTVDLTTAKLINFLSREEKFNITEQNKKSYHNLGAEHVRRIYKRAQDIFEKEDMRIKMEKEN